MAEFPVLALMRCLGATWDVTVALSCAHNRMGLNRSGLLVPFPAQSRMKIEDLGFLWDMKGTQFDPVMSYVAFKRAVEVNWSGLDGLDQWHP